MLWLKSLHLIFVVTWFAGLFYLPRLFVYHAMDPDPGMIARFKIMEYRLLMITHIGGALAVVFGLALLWWWASRSPAYLTQGWLLFKLALVALLAAYHGYLAVIVRRFARGANRRSHLFYRWVNEIPSIFLIVIVILAVVKPF